MIRGLSIIFAAGLITTGLFGQRPGPRMEHGDFDLMHAEFGGAHKVVQGAPYSAQAVTQFTQTLANGDHIQRSTTASMARDSQGRTRTERTLGNIGALSAQGAGARAVMIFDPVAGKSYMLDAASHMAHSSTIPAARTRPAGANEHARPERSNTSAKTEELGTQVIQGVSAQGKRVTRVIPAGREGNEKEIDIVSETWYSPDLQVMVMSKTSDPRFGESVYQLNAITRAEPDPALFTVPADYTVKEGRPMMHRGPGPAQ